MGIKFRQVDLRSKCYSSTACASGGVEGRGVRVPTHRRVTPSMRQAKGKGEPRTVPLTEACKLTNHIQCQCATENLSTKAFFFVLGGVVGAGGGRLSYKSSINTHHILHIQIPLGSQTESCPPEKHSQPGCSHHLFQNTSPGSDITDTGTPTSLPRMRSKDRNKSRNHFHFKHGTLIFPVTPLIKCKLGRALGHKKLLKQGLNHFANGVRAADVKGVHTAIATGSGLSSRL